MAEIHMWTEQAFRKRGFIDEPWLSGIERRYISTPEEIMDALNSAALPGPRREFIVVDEED